MRRASKLAGRYKHNQSCCTHQPTTRSWPICTNKALCSPAIGNPPIPRLQLCGYSIPCRISNMGARDCLGVFIRYQDTYYTGTLFAPVKKRGEKEKGAILINSFKEATISFCCTVGFATSHFYSPLKLCTRVLGSFKRVFDSSTMYSSTFFSGRGGQRRRKYFCCQYTHDKWKLDLEYFPSRGPLSCHFVMM